MSYRVWLASKSAMQIKHYTTMHSVGFVDVFHCGRHWLFRGCFACYVLLYSIMMASDWYARYFTFIYFMLILFLCWFIAFNTECFVICIDEAYISNLYNESDFLLCWLRCVCTAICPGFTTCLHVFVISSLCTESDFLLC